MKFKQPRILNILVLALCFVVTGRAVASDRLYRPSWNSLSTRQTPQWLRDGKFGIYTHWGVYSVPAQGPNGTWFAKRAYPRRWQTCRTSCLATLVLAGTLSGWAAAEPVALTEPKRAIAQSFVDQMRAGVMECQLDELLRIPEVWSLTPDRLDAAFAVPKGVEVKKNPYFQWMTVARTRAVFSKHPYTNLRVDLTLMDRQLAVEEVVVDFLNNKLNGITFSLGNRGDSGTMTAEEFQRRFKLCGTKINAALVVHPTAKKADLTQGLLSEGWTWVAPLGMAILEHNPEANQGKVEFLRLKIAPRDAKGAFAAAFQGHSMAAKLSELPKNVTKSENGDVFIKDMPMVDQGQKGYCVVATVQRLFEYYGMPVDQHQIAQVVGTDAKTGTNSVAMAEALAKIDYRFKTHFKIIGMANHDQLVEVDARKMTVGKNVSEDQFSKAIHRHINEGIPLLWGLVLGKYPEDPPTAQQTSGGHMRMVIGYNDKTGHLLFSDSWGAGHELKRMTLADSYKATQGLFVMSPTVH